MRQIIYLLGILLFSLTSVTQTYADIPIIGDQDVLVGEQITYTATTNSPVLTNWIIVNGSEVSRSVNTVGSQFHYSVVVVWHTVGAGSVTLKSGNVSTVGSTLVNVRAATGSGPWTESNGEVYYSGNVGIGNTNPTYKLDVNGDIRANSGWIRSTADYGIYNNSDATYFFSDDANYWRTRSDRGITIANRANTRKGVIYHDNANSFGLLDADAQWSVRFERDSNTRWYINNSQRMTLDNAGLTLTGNYKRTAHNTGHLEGSYNNIGENSTRSNPIYTIGSSYNPSSTTLSNMYGVGYTHKNASFINSTDLGVEPSSHWGMYVAADGNARIFLNAGHGNGYFKGGLFSQNVNTRGNLTLGSSSSNQAILSGSANRPGLLKIKENGSDNWSGVSLEHTSTSAWSLMGDQDDFGLYDDYNNKWAVLYNENGSTDIYHNGSKKLNTTSSGINVNGSVTATGGNSTNWNTAFGWGNHASAGYYKSGNNPSFGSITTSGNLKLTGASGTILESTNTGVQTIRLTNDNILGVNRIEIADPGDAEGIAWSGGAQAKVVVSPLNGGNADGYLRVINDGGISFEAGSTNREDLIINSAGNIGMGTESVLLGYKLDIRGNVNMTKGVKFDCNDCGSTSSLFGASNWGDLTIQGRVLSASNNLHLSPPGGSKVIINSTYRAAGGSSSGNAGLSVGGETLLAVSSGNVGIGLSSAPSAKLDVNGSARIRGLSPSSNALVTVDTNGNLSHMAIPAANTDNQNLSLSGNVLSLTNDPSTVNLSAYLDNTDDQNITGSSLVGTNLTIGIEGGTSQTINLASLQDGTGTDNQNISGSGLSGTTLTIGIEGGNSQTVNLASLKDGTGTDNQILSHNNSTHVLSLEDGGSVNLSQYLDDTNTQLTEIQVDNFVSNNGYLTSETDDQNLTLSGNILTLENGGSVNLSQYLDDTNTQLTETQVDDFVSNNGYLTSETDDQNLTLSGNILTLEDGGTVDLTSYMDNTDTQLTEAQVDAFIANNGYLTSETDDQSLTLSGNNLILEDGGTVDLSAFLDNTNTQLTETEVDSFVANNGYLTVETDDQTAAEVFYDKTSSSLMANDVNSAIDELDSMVQTGAAGQWSAIASDIYFNTGNVAIGADTAATGYALSVAGNVIVEEIDVRLQGDWPDYVFEKGYQLSSLEATEAYISENKHLPNMPSAITVEKEGFGLGEMNAKLLEKIEELTLHLIDQNKKIEALIQENQEVKTRLQGLEDSK